MLSRLKYFYCIFYQKYNKNSINFLNPKKFNLNKKL